MNPDDDDFPSDPPPGSFAASAAEIRTHIDAIVAELDPVRRWLYRVCVWLSRHLPRS